ncbi:MAG: protein-L-isoaspartate(D-aspartate) O-methyltransferase [Planctomycetota bacterium]|nr:MAG: protein-L-isoaspartate(D-aspartate) O-methyltransferase [Planctomycetota bacterium]REJ96872.1 MAG: protein-L-isoaspartate(D-aspartate) O-methyltransferase [Planctomycetota bacterium]
MFDNDADRKLREAMVADQLAGRGISDPRVLAAMREVSRAEFVPEEIRARAYDDGALPIECDQTISQPLIVAMMTAALALRGTERVLEVGTGSGYQAAVLSRLAGEVVTIERHEPLHRTAAARLRSLGCGNVLALLGDGTRGCPERAPYDGILVTAATAAVPPALLEQLADGGRLVIPLGDADSQELTLFERHGDRCRRRMLTRCRFVPLIAEAR